MCLPKHCYIVIIYFLVDNVRLSPTWNKDDIWEMISKLIFKLLAWDFFLFFFFFSMLFLAPSPSPTENSILEASHPVAYTAGRKKLGG